MRLTPKILRSLYCKARDKIVTLLSTHIFFAPVLFGSLITFFILSHNFPFAGTPLKIADTLWTQDINWTYRRLQKRLWRFLWRKPTVKTVETFCDWSYETICNFDLWNLTLASITNMFSFTLWVSKSRALFHIPADYYIYSLSKMLKLDQEISLFVNWLPHASIPF